MPTDKFIEIGDNETLSTIVEKINANFNQVRSLGGGPQGPQGKQGIPGLPGLQGPQGIKGDKGEAGTKIVPLESKPNDQDMELGYLYIYSDDNKNLFASYLEDNGGEVERIDTKIVDNKIISSDGYLEQINTRDESTVMTRLIKRSVSEEGREAGLKIGVGESGKNESLFNSNISCFDADEDCSPENSSKLLLFSRKNFGAKLPIRGEDKQVNVSPQLFIGSEKTSSVIGTYEYGSDRDNNGVAILGYDEQKSNLFVNGEVMSDKGFTANFSGEAKTFGGKGKDGEFNFGHINADGNLSSGLNVKGSDVTLKSVKDVTLESGNTLTFNIGLDEDGIDGTTSAITIDTNGREGYLLDYKAKEGEGSTLRIEDKGDLGMVITNANKPFTINGLNGDVEMQFMKKQGAESPGSFHMSFGKDGGSEDGGIFADYDRISYYGKDGMQIKLSNINTTIEREYSNNASDKHIYSNLIEFCYERQSSSSGKDYVYEEEGNNGIYNRSKIGEITASSRLIIENIPHYIDMNIVARDRLKLKSLSGDIRVDDSTLYFAKKDEIIGMFSCENIDNDKEFTIKSNGSIQIQSFDNTITARNFNNEYTNIFIHNYLTNERYDVYVDTVYVYCGTTGLKHIIKKAAQQPDYKKLGTLTFSGAGAYMNLSLSNLAKTYEPENTSGNYDKTYPSICVTLRLGRKGNNITYYIDLSEQFMNSINNNSLQYVGGNYVKQVDTLGGEKSHAWFFRDEVHDEYYIDDENNKITNALLCVCGDWDSYPNVKIDARNSYINAFI